MAQKTDGIHQTITISISVMRNIILILIIYLAITLSLEILIPANWPQLTATMTSFIGYTLNGGLIVQIPLRLVPDLPWSFQLLVLFSVFAFIALLNSLLLGFITQHSLIEASEYYEALPSHHTQSKRNALLHLISYNWGYQLIMGLGLAIPAYLLGQVNQLLQFILIAICIYLGIRLLLCPVYIVERGNSMWQAIRQSWTLSKKWVGNIILQAVVFIGIGAILGIMFYYLTYLFPPYLGDYLFDMVFSLSFLYIGASLSVLGATTYRRLSITQEDPWLQS
ncbi:MAG: glycerophosphoryl diester phosphodiesterase membrane domain-containing protein [Candidatus Thorarchaeota archaeon]